MKNRIVAFVIAITMIGASSASAFDLFGGSSQKGSTQKGGKRHCSLFSRGCDGGKAVQKGKRNGSTQKGATQKGGRRHRGCGCGK